MAFTADRRYLSDPRRVNEFRKYYQSKHTLHRQSVIAGSRSPPSDSDHSDTLAAAVTEPDFTVGAYATCVVHSIDADKVMVSLLDDTTQYFLGGATKHTSTVVEGDENPELWFGCNSIGIAGGICEVACSVTPDVGEYPFYVIPDIADEPRWRDVVGTYRFYAGIPITTRAGYNIGTLFAFSTRPRAQLERREKLVLERMAQEIMNHLELELHVLERNRLLRMNQSLAQFTAGRDTIKLPEANTSTTDLPRGAQSGQKERKGPEDGDERALDPRQSVVPSVASSDNTASSTQPQHRTTQQNRQEFDGPSSVLTKATMNAKLSAPSSHGASQTPSNVKSDAARRIARSSQHSSTYKRAATMLRDGMECTGVVFLSIDRNNFHRGRDSRATLLGGDTGEDTIGDVDQLLAFPAHVLRELLDFYVHGQIFYFDSAGRSSSTGEDDQPASVSCQPHLITYPASDTESEYDGGEETYGQDLARSLQLSIPDAKQVLVVPLQSTRDDTMGVAVAWNNNWNRVMTHAVELPFTLGFCANIFVEISHQEAIVANRQKADFIANVSHELRSPLHGILATSELLKETACSQLQHSLVEDVQSCGRVLLNTIDHVLDFSNLIRSERRTPRPMRERNDSNLTSPGPTISPDHPSYNSPSNPLLLNQPTNLDLAVLFEDVTDSIFISRFFHNTVSSTSTQASSVYQSNITTWLPPVVSINIAANDWNFVVQPGAMQRIVMNLLGNAIKYTTRGFIQVDLTIDELPTGEVIKDHEPYSTVTLVVRDSGRGLSSDYIRTRLWCAFAQEDQTVRGTGLGLSITRKIVGLMGGTIDLQSTLNVGTTVTVKLPLRRVPRGERNGLPTTTHFAKLSQDRPTENGAEQSSEMLKLGQGRTVLLCLRRATFDGPGTTQRSPGAKYANEALVHYLREWFSFTIVEQLEAGSSADLIIVDEERMSDAHFPPNIPRLVLKDSSYISLDDRETTSVPSACLRRPVAPRKLERALREVLGRCTKSSPTMDPSQQELAPAQNDERNTDSMTPTVAGVISTSSTISNTQIVEDQTTMPMNVSSTMENLTVRASSDRRGQTGVIPDNSNPTPAMMSVPRATNGASDPQISMPKVLVVDDNPINVKVLCAFLFKHKIARTHVVVAINGLDAVQQFLQARMAVQPFDIVLMDLNMPVKDGFEAIVDIRQHEKSEGICPTLIVALTGLVSERDQERAFTAGADQFFSKPFSGTQVRGIVDAWQEESATRTI